MWFPIANAQVYRTISGGTCAGIDAIFQMNRSPEPSASGTMSRLLSLGSSFAGPVFTALLPGPVSVTLVNLSSTPSENLSLSSVGGGIAISFAAGVDDTSCAWASACSGTARQKSHAARKKTEGTPWCSS